MWSPFKSDAFAEVEQNYLYLIPGPLHADIQSLRSRKHLLRCTLFQGNNPPGGKQKGKRRGKGFVCFTSVLV